MEHTNDSALAIMDCIATRLSVRQFAENAPIDDNQVEQLLRAAMAAPSACNSQPWRFMVVKKQDKLTEFGQTFQNAHMAAGAPLLIMVCGDSSAFLDGEKRDFWIQDCSAAVENMLLAAHALGLGAVWCGIYPRMEKVVPTKEMFDLPDNIIPLAAVVIGHPRSAGKAKDKWHPEFVHYETWHDHH